MHSIPHPSLTRWASACLRACGVSEQDAETVAAALVQTSLWGIDSHGIARLPHYLACLRAGSINPRPAYAVERTAAGTARFGADHGLGIAAMFAATDVALDLAREAGAGVVGLADTTHCGAIGLYTRHAAHAGCIGIAFTHADSIVAPAGGTQKFLGTNPISIAFPRAGGEPLCLDMATSSIPWNRVMNDRREGRPLPPDVALDAAGAPTTDPHAAACLVPLGGADFGYKGYALALMIDLMCGPLNGMASAGNIGEMYGDLSVRRKLGGLTLAIDPARFSGGAFSGGAALAQRVADFAASAHAQPGEVKVPGDPELAWEAQRRRDGIPIEPGLYAEIEQWSQLLNLSVPS
jgi:ureidoglycolate dehydrogenase (NAD+)